MRDSDLGLLQQKASLFCVIFMVMDLSTGRILISSSAMEDANFRQSVIFITEYNGQGAMGFVVNKMFERTLNELAEFSTCPPFPLYRGGPVDNEHLFFIHRRSDLISGGVHIIDKVYLGGNFKHALSLIANKTITSRDIKIFIGYCGWDILELEEEIAEGSWGISDSDLEIIFNEDPMLF